MANYLAIATVTAAIKQLLVQEISAEIRGSNIQFKIYAGPPDVVIADPTQTCLNIFLYNIAPNVGYANNDLPSYGSTGEFIQRQQMGLNLYYLLTVCANKNDDLIAHRLIASAMRILNEKPILNKTLISSTINELATSDVNITGSDLVDQIELVKISNNNLSFDEITKLWSSFFQSPYRLSLSYEATVVLITSKQQIPKPSLLVQEREVFVFPFKQPIIERIEPQVIEYDSSSAMILNITGRNLDSDDVAVTVGKQNGLNTINQQDLSIGNDKISIKLPTNLTVGLNQIQIKYNTSLDPKKTLYQSSTFSFMVFPRITSFTFEQRNLRVEFEPLVTRTEKVSVVLGNPKYGTFQLSQNNITINQSPATIINFNIPEEFITKAFQDLDTKEPQEAPHKTMKVPLRVLLDDTYSLLRSRYDPKHPEKSVPTLMTIERPAPPPGE